MKKFNVAILDVKESSNRRNLNLSEQEATIQYVNLFESVKEAKKEEKKENEYVGPKCPTVDCPGHLEPVFTFGDLYCFHCNVCLHNFKKEKLEGEKND